MIYVREMKTAKRCPNDIIVPGPGLALNDFEQGNRGGNPNPIGRGYHNSLGNLHFFLIIEMINNNDYKQKIENRSSFKLQ